MLAHLITALLLVVAVIHLIPITGFFGADRLSALYGIDVDNPDLEILMRHRAVLFGLLGTFIAYAAFTPALQPFAFVAAAVSLSSFLYLAVAAREYGPAVRKIVVGDVVAIACLVGSLVLYVIENGP